ncbi:helix-turn-helix transcriptional regulator [Nitratireductor thuwali]|uniref:HTH luxR-type domain-containing protein n=1 Tax=Nitratireductor thuwali TaxID=2267699 RepID=A0ABY5MGI0_9HYPH|nr:hypothetical protein NTH_01346 [Nitratireductor thuwali]
MYDERQLDVVASEIAEAIEQACFGAAPWSHACELFSSAFPGGFTALMNQDFIHERVNFHEIINMESVFVDSYCARYGHINPWVEMWTRMPSGSVFVAERDRPARTFTHTEYYNDWLMPQGDVIAGVGLKVDASPTDVIFFPIHYPQRYSEKYDVPAAEISRRLVGVIERAAGITGALNAEAEKLTAPSALVERHGGPAFVVDGSLQLTETNEQAIDHVSRGRLVRCRSGRLSFTDRRLNKRVAGIVRDLSRSPAAAASRCLWEGADGPWVLHFARLPSTASLPTLLPRRTQVLIVMKSLADHSPLDIESFARHFGLTPAERRFCVSLFHGRTLLEAALEHGISHGTARQRMKAIFQKTGTHRQSELCLLLARLSL